MRTWEFVTLNIDLVALIILIIYIPFFALFTIRAMRGFRFKLRPIVVYDRLQHLVDQGIESGQSLHVGIGSGALGGSATPDSSIGLTVLDYVAQNADATDPTLQSTLGDATLLPAAQGILRAARQESGPRAQHAATEVQFVGPDAMAYASGTEAALARSNLAASVMLGEYGAEGLWMAEAIREKGVTTLGGTSDPASAALMALSCKESVIGEDLYAAGAYLHRKEHLGSLATQDLLRIIIISAIIAGVILASLGYWG